MPQPQPLKRLKNWCPKNVDQKFYVGRTAYLTCRYQDMVKVFNGAMEDFDKISEQVVADDFSKDMATPIWGCLESLVDGIQAWCAAENIRQFGKTANIPKKALFEDCVDSKSPNFQRMFKGTRGYAPPWQGICGTNSSHYLEDQGILDLLDAGTLKMGREDKTTLRGNLAYLRVAMYQVRSHRDESIVKNKRGEEIATVPPLTPKVVRENIYPKFCKCLTILKKSLVPQDLKELIPQPLTEEEIKFQKTAKKQEQKQQTKDDYTQAVVESDNPGKEIGGVIANLPPDKQRAVLAYLETEFPAFGDKETTAEATRFTL